MKVKLKNFIEIVENGTRDKGGAVKKGIPSLGAEHLNTNGTINWSIEKMKYISFELFNKMKTGIMKKDDVLIVKDGATTGKVAYVDDIPYNYSAINEHVFLLRPKKELLPKYLFYYLASKEGKQKVLFYFRGATVGGITKDFLNIDIPLTSISEQKKIANILDKVTNLIELRKKQLEKLDIVSKALFVEMFGDPVENPMNWKKDKLMNLGYLGRGISKHRPRNDPKLLGGKYPLIQTGDISKNDLFIDAFTDTYSEDGLKQSKLWNKNTLCITIAANIAKTSILAIEACFPDSIVGFVPEKKIDNIFLHYWFKFFQKILEEQAPESAQKNINLKILSNLNVIVPPIELQNKFAKRVEHIDKIKSTIQDSSNKLETLKKSLMQEYFS